MIYICILYTFLVALSNVYGGVIQNRNPSIIFGSSFLPKENHVNQIAGGSCDDYQFNSCTNQYAKELGLSSLPAESIQFYYYILGMVNKDGLDGFEQMCKATNDYVACVGERFDTCMTVANLEAIGFSSESAPGYATTIEELKFECGPAYDIFYEHHECVVTEVRLKTYQLLGCMEIFNISVHANPKKLCDLLQQFTECNMNVFAECGADLTTALCLTFDTGYSVSMPMCRINCGEQSEMLIPKTSNKKHIVS